MSASVSEPSAGRDTLERAATQPAAVRKPRRISPGRLFIRALGISFFSVLSVFIALYAFASLPQVQDVLLDARSHRLQEALYWAYFYLIGIFVWALPLVFAARLLLLQNFDLIGIDTEERFKFYIFVFPRFYAIVAFIAVLVGMIHDIMSTWCLLPQIDAPGVEAWKEHRAGIPAGRLSVRSGE